MLRSISSSNDTTYIPNSLLTPQSTSSTDFSAFNQNTNRIATGGFGYDTSGNLTGDPTTGANAIIYDAENHQTSYTKAGATTGYSYDGDGRRVKRTNPDNSSTIFVYNVVGQLIAEYTSGTPTGSGTSYLTTDHLGSTRVVTKSDGSVKARYDYLPFGEELPSTVGSRSSVSGYSAADSTRQKFTQKERDSESGLDYFLSRYYSSAQGRFTSVDPENAGADPDDAQSWNGYAYARNNPLLYVDQTGRDYDLYDKDGKLLGRVKDASELDKKGYKYTGSEDNGNLLHFKGGFTARYVEGVPGGVQVHDNSGMTPLARGVFLELDRRAAASIKLIDIASQITLTPISIISGTALFRGGITSLALTGAKLATKQAARQALARMALSEAQRVAANKAISKATASSTIEIIQEGSNVIVNVSRRGFDGHQVLEYTIDAAGNKQLIQKAFDAAGKLVHYDPKTP